MNDIPGVSVDRLRSVIDRIERLEQEKAALTADIKEVYAEAKESGFDTRALRQIMRLRKLDQADRKRHEMVVDTYMRALGM